MGRFPVKLLVLVAVTAPAGAQRPIAGLDELVVAAMHEWQVPGVAVAACRGDRVVISRGYGRRDVDAGLPVTTHTLFAIGSNTKSFTASLLGMLVDDGLLDWATPVRDYLPEFRLQDEFATEQMTAEDLLCHDSGLPCHDLLWYANGLDRGELIRRLRFLRPSRPFRAEFQYQNLMFMAAGVLVERLTGRTWEDNVRTRILAPLGMTRTAVSIQEMERDEDFARPYAVVDGGITRIPPRNLAAIAPAGAIISSAAEMMRYVRWQMRGGRVGGRQLLSAENARRMQRPRMVIGGALAEELREGPEIGEPLYGLGLGITSYRGHRHILHGGSTDGFVSAMEWLPNDDIGVVVLSNCSGDNPVPRVVARRVLDLLLGLEPIDWAGRIRENMAHAREKREEARRTAALDRKPGTSPSHRLADYAGDYEDPAYGRATIRLVGDRLSCRVVGLELPLDHWHYDVFVVPADLAGPVVSLVGMKLRFWYGAHGDIDRVAMPLEPAVDDILFRRVQTGKEAADVEGK